MGSIQLVDLYKITKQDIEPASWVLARAFQFNPPMIWEIPDESIRVSKLASMWRIKLCTGVKYGEVFASSKNLEGIAMWLNPQMAETSLWKFIKCGGIKLLFKLGIKSLRKMMHAQNYQEKVRKKYIQPPYWHLGPFGVDPEFQGKGYGSKLLWPMLNRIDEADLPIYLETAVEKNVPMYEHFGFEVVLMETIPDTTITNWAMIRRKKSSR